MKESLVLELDHLFDLLDQSSLLQEIEVLQKKLLSDSDLCRSISTYQKMKYPDSIEAVSLRNQIYQNSQYCRYQSLENELYYLILEINQRFSKLTDRKVCG